MFSLDTRRQHIRDEVEDWLHDHQDPADPLTTPVRLLLHMFMAGTHRGGVFVAGLAGATLAMVIGGTLAFAVIHANDHVIVPPGERAVMQEWIDSGVPSQLMRCQGEGLEFVGGRCRTVNAGGWLIPLAAQQALPDAPPAAATDGSNRLRRHHSASTLNDAAAGGSGSNGRRSSGTFPNPFATR